MIKISIATDGFFESLRLIILPYFALTVVKLLGQLTHYHIDYSVKCDVYLFTLF